MQLKGLIKIFTILLILICVYQLSFTWIVKNHEGKMEQKAAAWVKANYIAPEKKYAGNPGAMSLYKDSLIVLQDRQLARLLDSTKEAKIGPFGMTTYKDAKDRELMLGLDLQGGMSVTMSVSFDELLKSLSGNSKDANLNKAIEIATAKKAQGETDFIGIFVEEFNKLSNNAPLAPFFERKSSGAIKYDESNDKVVAYLRAESESAFKNTTNILRSRIDRFGVAAPAINPDVNKGVITIELAGAKDPERVRKYLQSTANLQFFEVYNLNQYGDQLLAAEKALAASLKGEKVDSAGNVIATQEQKVLKTAADSLANTRKEFPVRSLLQGMGNFGGFVMGYVATADTALFNEYINNELFKSKLPSNLVVMYGKAETDLKGVLPVYAIKTLEDGSAELDGERIVKASQGFDHINPSKATVEMSMDVEGANIWANMTKRNINKPIAIVLDNIVLTAPNVNDEITGGNSQISGNFQVQEAQDMANILQSGKLKAPAKIVSEQIVGPTLGDAAVKGGMLSFLISFLVIFALMLLYYNSAGWIANVALILNLLFTIGILSALGFTLTAPGIAGLVLTIGMAVDTNVIIFERIKEELKKGKSHNLAIQDGYRRSYSPVLDGHITSLLTAAILFYFGLGPVLGFATTQIIGLLLSMFCGIMVSRLISDMYTTKDRHFKYFTALSEKIFNHRQFKFVEFRKIAYIVFAAVIIGGVAALFNGFDEGVEFAGGRSYTIKFENTPNQEQLRSELKAVLGNETPIVKTVDNNNQLNITTSYRIHEQGIDIDKDVETKLFEGLKKYLPADATLDAFINTTTYKQSSHTVLPIISADLKRGATKATIIALIVICLYIFIRFRDWRYSLGTILALLHDVFLMLIVFSFLRHVVPFPMEIDQHFIAAILTVIGFSMNDTIIVYDRIRENSRLLHGTSKKIIINKAINETLSRTIMTSLTVWITLLILFIFGGETLRGFSFAMLIGVLTGTYSSVFVAAPILMDIGKKKSLGKADASQTAVEAKKI